jgi:hypothetical protein
MKAHYLLGEAAKVLNRKPHQIVHVLTTGKIPEPTMRIANKRLFTSEDVDRLAQHFRVTPNWTALEPLPTGVQAEAPKRLALRPPFDVRQVGESGHEIRDAEGEVFGWTGDRGHALLIAGLLEVASRG